MDERVGGGESGAGGDLVYVERLLLHGVVDTALEEGEILRGAGGGERLQVAAGIGL